MTANKSGEYKIIEKGKGSELYEQTLSPLQDYWQS